jgi:hypothetical protein
MKNLAISKDNLTETINSIVCTLLSEELNKRNINENSNVPTTPGYGPLTFLMPNYATQQTNGKSIPDLIEYLKARGSKMLGRVNTDTIIKALQQYQQNSQNVVNENIENLIKQVL